MAKVYVGTGYNQVVHFQTNDKTKKRHLYGTLARAPVHSIAIDPANDRLLYATARSIVAAYSSGEVEQVVTIKTANSIVRTEYIHPHSYLRYCLSDGSIHCIPTPALHTEQPPNQDLRSQTQFLSQKHSKFTFATSDTTHERYLFCGAGVVPLVENLATGVVDWFGKNVKDDQLDLQVPMKDIDADFINDQRAIAVLHADRKLRLYDIRGTHRRPVRDIPLATTDKSQLTRMLVQGQYEYYFSNDIGEVFRCDSRKDWQVVNKFKGITASVTDFQLTKHCLYVTSLDSYVHLFDRHTNKLLRKFYINKPAYCLRVEQQQDEDQGEQVQGEVELELEEEEVDEPKKKQKLKQIRKRNKVGLKYLQPRQFDEPTQLKMQEVKQKQWYQDLNPTDRRDFQQ